MDRIEDYRAYLAIVEQGSLTAAARRLGRSLQAVSRALAAVEREVGVELIRRTTRRCTPTEAGLALHQRLSSALDEIEAAKREAVGDRSGATGLLRITTGSLFGPLYLMPAVTAFLDKHPRLEIELDLSDRFVDLVGEGFDLAIRIGAMADSTLRVRRLAGLRRVVFGAPGYFARQGRPAHPSELTGHQCILRTAQQDGRAWPFVIDRRPARVLVCGRLRTSSAAAANQAALQGFGLASAPLWQIRPALDRGEAELVLEDFEPPPVLVQAVWPATRLPPAKTTLFVEFLADRLRKERI